MVQLLIYIFEDIENDLYFTSSFLFIVLDGFDGDFGGAVVREHEYTRGDAAKCNTFHVVFVSNLQAGTITGSKQFFVLFCQSSFHIYRSGLDASSSASVTTPFSFAASCR